MKGQGGRLARFNAILPRRPELDTLEKRLLECEDTIRLLDRVTPASLSRVIEGFVTGAEPLDPLKLPAVALAGVDSRAQDLEQVMDQLDRLPSCLRAELLRERTIELMSEHERALCLGTTELLRLTRSALNPHETLLAEADLLCADWLAQSEAWDRAEERADSDPPVLLEEMARLEIESRGIAVRVLVRDMPSRAAAGPNTLFVQRQLVVRRSVAKRILVHELEGHILPRLAATRAGAPFSIGPSGTSLDEEGFALFLERRGNFLTLERRREIGLRYRAARRVLSENSPEEIVGELEGLGLSRAAAIRVWARAARGPGLGRELCYLMGFARVSSALTSELELESWFRLGRMSVPAAQRLELLVSESQ